MGLTQIEAEERISLDESKADQANLAKIIRSMRRHKVYPDRDEKEVPPYITTNPVLSKVLSEPNRAKESQAEIRPRFLRLNDVQKALGGAHFELKSLIESKDARARATITRGETVERRASVPEQVWVESVPTRQRISQMPGAIPDYDLNRIWGASFIEGEWLEVSEIEIS